MERLFDVIIGGPTSRGDSSSSHKAYAQATNEKCLRITFDLEIIFKKEDMKYLDPNHNYALVVSIRMINTKMKMVIIDISISASILYFDAFQKLELSMNNLTPMTSLLMGFTSNSIILWV